MTPAQHCATRRTLTVLVDELAVEDGQIEPPAVGEVLAFPLLFVETVGTQPDSMTVRGTLEPDQRSPAQGRTSLSWRGLLRGDGWTATWQGPRPRTGRVEVTGQFFGVIGIDASGSVRGRVTSVDVVSEYWNRVDTRERWTPLRGRREYRRVATSPRFFVDERFTDPRGPARAEVGALITLDLDDVPDLPLRKDFVAGGVSALNSRVWSIDRELPVVVRHDENQTPTAHFMPAPVASGRSVFATPAGCWVSGRDGTYRIDADGPPCHQVCSVGATVCAVNGERLLTCPATGPWQIHEIGRDPINVAPPDGAPIGAVPDADTFVVLLELRLADQRRLQLVRVTPTGARISGPAIANIASHRIGSTQLLGNPPLIAHERGFAEVTPDLDIGQSRLIPRNFFDAGTVGDHLWTIGHPPDPTSKTWWPLDGPTDHDHSRGQVWLLTILDRRTLQPVHVTPVLSSRPSLTADSSGTIWLASAGELMRIGDIGESMQWPEIVDVDLPDH